MLRKPKFDFEHEMTVGDLIDYLLQLDSDTPIYTSVFKPRSGLIHKSKTKFSQIKLGLNALYINTYLKD